jgi:hypothetical protein
LGKVARINTDEYEQPRLRLFDGSLMMEKPPIQINAFTMRLELDSTLVGRCEKKAGPKTAIARHHPG